MAQLFNPISKKIRPLSTIEEEALKVFDKDPHGPFKPYNGVNLMSYRGLICFFRSDYRLRLDIWVLMPRLEVRIDNKWFEAKQYQVELYVDFIWTTGARTGLPDEKTYIINSIGTKAKIFRSPDGNIWINREKSKAPYLLRRVLDN